MSILDSLREWGKTLPFWQQYALDVILAGEEITDQHHTNALQFLLEDKNLREKNAERPEIRFLQLEAGDTNNHQEKPVRLVQVSHLENINALVPDQRLTFSPRLTIIFGENGSGKSGYARVLGASGFTRGDRDILPNIMEEYEEPPEQTAVIEVQVGDETKTLYCQFPEVQHPELQTIFMFDSTSVRAHLTDANEISFTPASLLSLSSLATFTDAVGAKLEELVETEDQPIDFTRNFFGISSIVEKVTSLDHDTNIEELRTLAQLSPDGVKQLEDLERKIGRLKSETITEQIAKLKETKADLERLRSRVAAVESALTAEAIQPLADDLAKYQEIEELVEKSGVTQFQTAHFGHTGSDAWSAFVQSAGQLAKMESSKDALYPQDGDICLLCHQPLGESERDLMHRLWKFLAEELTEKLGLFETKLNNHVQTLEALELDFFDEQMVAYRHLEQRNPALRQRVSDNLATLRTLCESFQAALQARVPFEQPLPQLPQSLQAEIGTVIDVVCAEVANLEKDDPKTLLEKLEMERNELAHKKILATLLDQIAAYVARKKWCVKTTKARPKTNSITAKQKVLFKDHVTDRYIENFTANLSNLGCPMRVQVKSTSSKAKSRKQLVLTPYIADSKPQHDPDKVLSEGEQRAIALADFLTEIELDPLCSIAVFDDPVTSLDHKWKERIANHLVAQVSQRQTIVFTHDLYFVYLLSNAAIAQEEEISHIHWIRRQGEDHPGFVHLHNAPPLEEQFKTSGRAQNLLKKAKEATSPDNEFTFLSAGYAALRTSYEALIIFEMLNGVVQRFSEQIKINNLNEVVFDGEIADLIIEKHGALSRFIEGHLHPDTSFKPTVASLDQEIKVFDELRGKVRGLKRTLRKAREKK
jgi:energy-coupling factor transporter ATP-binding protein EcfA2/biotin operon repressor